MSRDLRAARRPNTVTLPADDIGELIWLLGHLHDWLVHAGPAVRDGLSTFVATPAFASPTPVPAEHVLAELASHTETLTRRLHTHHRRQHPQGQENR